MPNSANVYLFLSLFLFLELCSAFLSAGNRASTSMTTMGLRSFLKETFLPKQQERTVSELKKGIAGFYDETTGVWLDVWGDHLHHGYYPSPNYRNHSAAQSDMVDRSLAFAFGGTHKVRCSSMVDVGCGVGGSARHIAGKVSACRGVGVSLSPYQISVANELTRQAGLSDRLSFQVADAMNMPFQDNSFDLVRTYTYK
jgi:tocopherol O-methyltransferase